MSQAELPEYNVALGDFLRMPSDPKIEFEDVVTQVYPLRAEIGTLKKFCDTYLNGGEGPEKSEQPMTFEPAAPWVLLQVCNYGKMALKSQNVGWVSQHELAFGFPVAWYEKNGGQRSFKDWALIYPFIYVDNPLSMSLGRQVYGWSKAGMELLPPRPNLEPNVRRLVSIDLKEGPEGHADKDPDRIRFLEIFQQSSLLSGSSGIASLYSLFPRAAGGYLSVASAILGILNSVVSGYDQSLSGSRTSGAPDGLIDLLRDLVSGAQMLTGQMLRSYSYIDSFLSGASEMMLEQERMQQTTARNFASVKIITLKQFRDAQSPDQACYRATVISTIETRRVVNGGPILSDPLLADPSGGIQIHLCHSRSQDIVGSLGIVRSEPTKVKGRLVSTLRPVLPFWVKMNLSCGKADHQQSRTEDTGWRIDQNPPPEPQGQRAKRQSNLPYIGLGSGATQEVPGRLRSANFSLRVFGLKADKVKLNGFLQEYVQKILKPSSEQQKPVLEFELTKPSERLLPGKDDYVVLMMVSSFEAVSIEDPKKNLTDHVLTFALPVKCTQTSSKKSRNVLLSLFTFAEADWDFLTEYEVYGRFAFKSILQAAPQSWLKRLDPERELLNVHTTLFPEFEEQEPARLMPVIRICALSHQLRVKKDADRDTAYEDLMGLIPMEGQGQKKFRTIGVKQVRDAITPKRAGYQAVVGVTRKFERAEVAAGDVEAIQLQIYGYKGMDLHTQMNLLASTTEVIKVDGITCNLYKLETQPGITIAGHMEEEDADNLCWSIEKGIWKDNLSALAEFFD